MEARERRAGSRHAAEGRLREVKALVRKSVPRSPRRNEPPNTAGLVLLACGLLILAAVYFLAKAFWMGRPAASASRPGWCSTGSGPRPPPKISIFKPELNSMLAMLVVLGSMPAAA